MTIRVTDYDPQWAESFEHLRATIWPAIRDVAESIEHVGSTSVVGLPAKPVIDLSIVVADRQRLAMVIERLAGIGYRHRGDLGIVVREAFAAPAGTPDHHLYACLAGSVPLRNHLALRDRLRRDPAAVAAYGWLKKQLAVRFPEDIDSYIAGKSAFILAILEEEGMEAAELAAIRSVNAPSPKSPSAS